MKTVPTTMNGSKNGTSAVTPTYPIRLLLDRLIYDSGQSQEQFLAKVGYVDIWIGLQQLGSWWDTGAGPGEFIERIAAAYPAIESELRLAIAATMYIKRIEAADFENGIPKTDGGERKMICESCKAGWHNDCTKGNCDCPMRKEDEAVERRLKAIRSIDERLASAVYTTLLYGGSEEARMLSDGAGRESVCSFVQQVIGTLRSMNG